MISNRRLGFTIVELIVVIAIIGVLVAILYPALTGARTRAKKVKELNLISHVGKAWSMYSMGHQDKLLPGYISTDVQAYKDQAWAFPDETLIPPAPDYEDNVPNEAGPWTWRLLDYLDYDWRSLLFYRDTEWTSNELREHADVIATQPAFGYNGFYIGGWWEIDVHENRPVVTFGSVELTDGRRINVVTTQASKLLKADNQIVFCSTFYAEEGLYYELDDDTPGTHFAIPSILGAITGESFTAKIASGMMKLIPLLDMLTGGGVRETARLLMIELLTMPNSDQMLEGIEPELAHVIIVDRNTEVLNDIAATIEIVENVSTIGILYGAGHMNDMALATRP